MAGLLDILKQHSTSVEDYWAGPIPRVDVSELTPTDFLRDYVVANRPCVLLNACNDWPAMHIWQDLDCLASLTQENVTLSITPNGRADALATHADGRTVFAKPHNVTLPFPQALDKIRSASTSGCGVPYLSYQNDSLRQQTPALFLNYIRDVRVAAAGLAAGETGGRAASVSTCATGTGSTAQLCTQAADAVNLWIGTPHSVSSVHKDPYENLYTVIRGRKRFTLLPPVDILWLYERQYAACTWVHEGGEESCVCKYGCGQKSGERGRTGPDRPPCWNLEYDQDDGRVPWVSVDVDAMDFDAFPLAAHASPQTVDVGPGETLYLPSLWYHQVAQPGPPVHESSTSEGDMGVTVAVNSWFNMAYLGGGYSSYLLAASLATLTTRDLGPS